MWRIENGMNPFGLTGQVHFSVSEYVNAPVGSLPFSFHTVQKNEGCAIRRSAKCCQFWCFILFLIFIIIAVPHSLGEVVIVLFCMYVRVTDIVFLSNCNKSNCQIPEFIDCFVRWLAPLFSARTRVTGFVHMSRHVWASAVVVSLSKAGFASVVITFTSSPMPSILGLSFTDRFATV